MVEIFDVLTPGQMALCKFMLIWETQHIKLQEVWRDTT